MPHFALSVDIERPQADVFAFVAEGANTPQWRKAAVDDRWLGDGPMRPGRRARAVRKQLGITVVLVPEIVDWDPPRYGKYRIVEGKLLGLEESYLFEPLTDGTRLTIAIASPPYPQHRRPAVEPAFQARHGAASSRRFCDPEEAARELSAHSPVGCSSASHRWPSSPGKDKPKIEVGKQKAILRGSLLPDEGARGAEAGHLICTRTYEPVDEHRIGH